MSERLLREYVRKILLSESGDRGFAYELTLVDALKTDPSIAVTDVAGNNNSISDLGFSVDGVSVGAEVKLGHDDVNLGAIRKHHFKSLSWDGKSFVGVVSPESNMADVAKMLIKSLNKSEVKKKFKDLESYVTPYKPLPWDLKSSFGFDAGRQAEKDLYCILRNEPNPDRQADFPIPPGASPCPRGSRQIANPGSGVANITAEEARAIIAGKAAPNGAMTNYVIVGHGAGSEGTPAGEIYNLGSDPLFTGAPIYDPASVGVEVRFGGSGGSSGGRRYSFMFKTKPTGQASPGLSFSSAQELVDIFKRGAQRKKANDAKRASAGGKA